MIIASCGKEEKKDLFQSKSDSVNTQDTTKQIENSKFTLKDFYSDNAYLLKRTEEIFNSLSDEERAGQMIITSAGKLGKGNEYVKELIREKKIGGTIILEGSKSEISLLIKDLSSLAMESKTLPLLFSCDGELTLINKKLPGSPKVLSAGNIKSEKISKESAVQIATYIKGLGFHQNYAPVCDFDLNEEIIGNRSFGHDEKTVINYSNAFIAGTQDNGIVATIKHFPGHGSVSGDSHKDIVYIEGDIKELNVFREVIKTSGVISVMVGHIAVINKSPYNTDGRPASVSKILVTDLLKKEMGFRGIVITDALNMGAVTKLKKPALNASLAGCDLLLSPTDENALHSSIIEEMKKNNAYKMQVYESVKKIIRLKICLGLI